ncbi:hypothetical protein [Streptomyces sp. NPDC054765]
MAIRLLGLGLGLGLGLWGWDAGSAGLVRGRRAYGQYMALYCRER